MDRPNILYIHSHDTGRFIQPYGHAITTPNLQRLAEQGVLFRQAFCAGPTCSPSRAALLTGQWPHNNGMLGLTHRGFGLTDYAQHLVHTLKSAGYTTLLAGAQHEASPRDGKTIRETIGYDRYLGDPPDAHQPAAAFLRNTPPEPFFLAMGFVETHRIFPAETPHEDPDYCLPAPGLPDTPETRLDMARFKESARILDAKMGTVLDALARSGLADRTLVVCTTDHGIAFPGMKCNLTDGGIGVMLILRLPRATGLASGRAIDALVSHVDVFPTVCDLAGIPHPSWLQGRSLVPLLRGEVSEVREELFAEVNYHAAYEPQRCVRTRRWKYIRRYDGRTKPVLPNCDDGLSKTVWLDHGWAERAPAEEALYDLVFDPGETNNLAADPAHQAIKEDMRQRLQRWMQQTDDPLLGGTVPAPRGARVNDPDGLSPQEPVRPAPLQRP